MNIAKKAKESERKIENFAKREIDYNNSLLFRISSSSVIHRAV